MFRLAFEHRLIDSVDDWMLYHRARNRTSHVYDQQVAKEVYAMTEAFLPKALTLKDALEQRND